jgi:hypothetical protein
MNATRLLLTEIVDYAGLFPPAKLDMASTVSNFHGYRDGSHAWMLGRLIVPVARLDEFETAAAGCLPRGEAELDFPWLISALTAPAGDERLRADIERIGRFNDEHAQVDNGSALIDTIELRADSPSAIEAALDVVPDHIMPFFELPVASDPRGLIAALAGTDSSAKVRTGGVTADLYPAPADLARFIAACADARVAFKATAGLHHPLRHHSDAVGTDEFGFLNVFVGAALAWTGAMAASELEPVLTETSIDTFSFDDGGITWRGHRLDMDAIESARERFCRSYGSCSFAEPIEDLVALHLLTTHETA